MFPETFTDLVINVRGNEGSCRRPMCRHADEKVFREINVLQEIEIFFVMNKPCEIRAIVSRSINLTLKNKKADLAEEMKNVILAEVEK